MRVEVAGDRSPRPTVRPRAFIQCLYLTTTTTTTIIIITDSKKHMWFSASNDLYQDAKRDLRDIGAGHIPTMTLNSITYGSRQLETFEVGGWVGCVSLLLRLACVERPPRLACKMRPNPKSKSVSQSVSQSSLPSTQTQTPPQGILFVTYSTSVGYSRDYDATTRVDQLVEWAGGESFNGVIAFDEGHRAKKLLPETDDGGADGNGGKKGRWGGKKSKSTKTAVCVSEIQQRLPKARVTYVSATGASALENLAYMRRLGLWGRENGTFFEDMDSFFNQSGFKNSVGALELLAMGE